MAPEPLAVELSRDDLRAVTGYAVACALPAPALFEQERPGDGRPRGGTARRGRGRTGCVLRRYPAAPPGGGRVDELVRLLDASLR